MSLGITAAGWVAIGTTVASAASSVYSSNQAAGAQSDAAKKNKDLSQQQFNTQVAMYEPARGLGYGAMSDLAGLYGYNLPGYTPLNSLVSGNYNYGTSSNPLLSGGAAGVKGSPGGYSNVDIVKNLATPFDPVSSMVLGGVRPSVRSVMDPLGLTGGGKGPRYGGVIDPISGTVTIEGDPQGLNAALTEYLRTGKAPEGRKFGKHPAKLIKAIDELRASGWTYDPNAAETAQNTAGPIAPGEGTGTSADGTSGNFGRFFTSPDYQFRQEQGQSALDRGAAARGGVLSGNNVAAGVNLSSNLAAGEYGSYVNRLLAMAGLGQTATAGSANASQNYTANVSNANTQQGDARASGVMGAANGISGAINAGFNNYYAGQYYNSLGSGTATPAAYSQYGPYASGYAMPNQATIGTIPSLWTR